MKSRRSERDTLRNHGIEWLDKKMFLVQIKMQDLGYKWQLLKNQL